jgi:thiamine pyrophosphate-dependent acetolactate synthase large subunit-like protein
MRERIKRAAKSLIQGNEPVLVELTPDVLDSQVPLIESNKRKRQKSNSEQGPKSKRKRPELKAV